MCCIAVSTLFYFYSVTPDIWCVALDPDTLSAIDLRPQIPFAFVIDIHGCFFVVIYRKVTFTVVDASRHNTYIIAVSNTYQSDVE